MRPLIENVQEFVDACTPLVRYLQKHTNPHVKVLVSQYDVEMVSTECYVPTSDYVFPEDVTDRWDGLS